VTNTPARLTVHRSPDALGDAVASRILAGIDRANESRSRFLLGAPTGRTPRPVLAALAAQLAARPRDLSRVTLVMMDEYLVPHAGKLAWASRDDDFGCHAYATREYLPALNASLHRAARVKDDAVWFPDPDDPAEYDRRIADAGGIDFFLLASGSSDGHVAFNQPGSPRDSHTRVVELSDPTRRDNLQTHPAFGSLDNVPRFGVTVGIATIASARAAAMVVWGTGKRETLRRITAATRYDPAWPATVIHEVPVADIVADEDAAGRPRS
jgi:glucosamine-6-phosphate deaminase